MRVKRSPIIATLSVTAFAVWLVSVSACSGSSGGDDAVAASADAPGAAPDPLDPPASEAAPEPSPFAAETPGGDEAAPGGGAGQAMEPSTPDNGPELQRPSGDGNETSLIAGLWDYSRVSDTGADTVFVAIDASGNVTEYDYQGDAVGDGNDCHLVSRATIASRGNGRYDIDNTSTLPGSRSVDDVLISVDAAEIVFRYLGSDGDPQFGGQLAGVTERYPAVVGRDAEELTICGGG